VTSARRASTRSGIAAIAISWSSIGLKNASAKTGRPFT